MTEKSPTLSPQVIQSVSRSFGLTLRLVPKRQRPAITLAYLLARAADTLSDSGSASSQERLVYLNQWEMAIFDSIKKYTPPPLKNLPKSEESLRLAMPSLIESFRNLSDADRAAVTKVVKTLMSAMKWDLQRFNGNFVDAPPMSPTDFDWYCYHIAGCVGDFWVDMFHLPDATRTLAVDYGKSLQRINILRDIAQDIARGRWYLPFAKSTTPWASDAWPAFLSTYISATKSGLERGLEFCNHLPRWRPFLRFASAMPAAIGIETLRLLATAPDLSRPIKISRKTLKQMATRTLVRCLFGRSL